MRSETDLLNREVDSDRFVVLHAGNAVSFLQIAGDAPLSTVTSDADSILGVVAPSLQQCP